MFWDSIFVGLKVLTYWETYVAGLEYLAVFYIPVGIAALLTERSEKFAIFGCLSMFVFPLLQVVALVVATVIFVFTMAPIILGASEDAAWILPWVAMFQAPDVFLKLIGMLVVTTLILTFTPVLNLFTSLHTLVLGGLTLLYVFKLIAPISLGGELVDYIPDFWFSVGLLAIGSILSWMGIVVTAFFLTVVGKVEESSGALALPFLGSVFGFIPVFMYGAWLGAQVRGGF
ncbi:MAG: hypothetical protein OXC38_00840 [Gammaproteobacteria bacterium]|nr:hypothetical protein [Gammaproteobacteria bacterium]